MISSFSLLYVLLFVDYSLLCEFAYGCWAVGWVCVALGFLFVVGELVCELFCWFVGLCLGFSLFAMIGCVVVGVCW